MSLTALAGATKPCLSCGGSGIHSSTDELGGVSTNSYCTDCNGAGRVYVFGDEVRVLCEECGGTGLVDCQCDFDLRGPIADHRRDKCIWAVDETPTCQGRGWTPNPDGWTWWRAALRALFPMKLHQMMDEWRYEWVHVQTDIEAAFFAALTEAVVAQGWQLGEEE